jgi:hypothetical protein
MLAVLDAGALGSIVVGGLLTSDVSSTMKSISW